MRAIVCGGRDLTNREHVFRVLDAFRETMGLAHVIEGGQRRKDRATGNFDGGADYWAMKWAQRRGLTWDTVAADWKALGNAAGPVRNGHMLSHYRPDCVIAFAGGKGTQNMIDRAERARVPVYRVREDVLVAGQR